MLSNIMKDTVKGNEKKFVTCNVTDQSLDYCLVTLMLITDEIFSSDVFFFLFHLWQKPSKRGMSVKRMRNSKKGVRLRTVGVKAVDENFKVSTSVKNVTFDHDKSQTARKWR